MKIKFLPAFNGDSILLSFQDENLKTRNILIDGGTPRTYQRNLKPVLEDLVSKGESIDLLVVSHIDNDHIGGIKELYQDINFKRTFIQKVWFNSGILLSDYFQVERDMNREVKIIMNNQTAMSVGQGVTLESILIKEDNWERDLIHLETKWNEIPGAKFTILSPGEIELRKLHERWEVGTEGQVLMSGRHDDFDISISEHIRQTFREDNAVPNGSSIAFLIETADSSAIFLGDAHPSVVENCLRDLGFHEKNKLKTDLIKVSHHASKKNTSPGLLSIIECDRFVILTDGVNHGHPDKEAMARIIAANSGCHLYFNYDSFINNIFTQEDIEQYSFSLHSLPQMNYTLNI